MSSLYIPIWEYVNYQHDYLAFVRAPGLRHSVVHQSTSAQTQSDRDRVRVVILTVRWNSHSTSRS